MVIFQSFCWLVVIVIVVVLVIVIVVAVAIVVVVVVVVVMMTMILALRWPEERSGRGILKSTRGGKDVARYQDDHGNMDELSVANNKVSKF